jgi:hypothetical protein
MSWDHVKPGEKDRKKRGRRASLIEFADTAQIRPGRLLSYCELRQVHICGAAPEMRDTVLIFVL